MPFFCTNGKTPPILFIHIPKTGGTSIEEYFSQKYGIPLNSSALYFRYHENTIQDEIAKKRTLCLQLPVLANRTDLMMMPRQKMRQDHTQDHTKKHMLELKQMVVSYTVQHSLHHLTWLEMKKYQDVFWHSPQFKADLFGMTSVTTPPCRIITVVRNPYDRMISHLFFLRKIQPSSTPEKVCSVIQSVLADPSTFDNHTIPQYQYLMDENGSLIPNVTILKTETLDEDMRRIGCTDFHLHTNKNPTMNSKKRDYISYLNETSIQIINEYYKLDFEWFDYPML